MTMPATLKTIFSLPMLLLYFFIYAFRFPILIFLLTVYTQTFSYGKAFCERIIGEFYFSESRHYDLLANKHFGTSLLLYTEQLATVTDPVKQGQIEALIGSQYECGKGVSPDLARAKKWYKQAAAHGNQDAQQALYHLDAYIKETKGKATMGKQCFALEAVTVSPKEAKETRQNP